MSCKDIGRRLQDMSLREVRIAGDGNCQCSAIRASMRALGKHCSDAPHQCIQKESARRINSSWWTKTSVKQHIQESSAQWATSPPRPTVWPRYQASRVLTSASALRSCASTWAPVIIVTLLLTISRPNCLPTQCGLRFHSQTLLLQYGGAGAQPKLTLFFRVKGTVLPKEKAVLLATTS